MNTLLPGSGTPGASAQRNGTVAIVLLVEDNPRDVRLVQELLRGQGARKVRLECAGTLAEATLRLERGGVDVALVDLGLPDSQGLDTCRRIREAADSAAVVIVLTGNLDEEIGLAAIRAGADDYLIKGQISGALLVRSVRYAMERRRTERMRSRYLEQQDKMNRLQQSLLGPGELRQKLGMITDGVVDFLGADFCRIWCIGRGDLCENGCIHAAVAEGPHVCLHKQRCLHLMASSGRYTDIEGATHRRVPFDAYKIGRVASSREHKFLTNDVAHDPRIHNREWARELGLVSFAGYQIRPPGGETLGILSLFSRHPITAEDDAVLDALSTTVAQVIIAAQADRALLESERRFRTLFEASGEGILAVDLHSRKAIYGNSALCGLLGYSPDEVLEMNIADLWHLDQLSGLRSRFEARLWRGIPIVTTVPFPLKDGRTIHVEIRAYPLEMDDRPCLLGFVTDVTEKLRLQQERDKLEAQLRQAQKMEAIGTLAGGIAHDFNNILGIIMGFAEMSLMDHEKKGEHPGELDQILKAADRAKDLVRQILAFSRQGEQEPRALQMSVVIKEALKMLRASLPTTIDIRQEVGSKGVVNADPTQIHQIVMNLCTNAAHAMRAHGGLLEVKLLDENLDRQVPHPDLLPGPYVKLLVRDTGCGINRDIHERIFDPFFTTKTLGEGTGLGLSVVHGIVTSYGGAITVQSEPGKGSAFSVYLPRIEISLGKPLDEASCTLPTGSERVLFIDDERLLAELAAQMLTPLGYEVTTQTNGWEALTLFRGDPSAFDLVITDQTMPRMTGADLAKELLQVRSNIPIILCTGFSESITREGAIEIGIRELLMKPLALKDLAETIRQVLSPAPEDNPV